jgi:hypothetical protein
LVCSDFAAVARDGEVHYSAVYLYDEPGVEKALAVDVGILRRLAHSLGDVSHAAFLGARSFQRFALISPNLITNPPPSVI